MVLICLWYTAAHHGAERVNSKPHSTITLLNLELFTPHKLCCGFLISEIKIELFTQKTLYWKGVLSTSAGINKALHWKKKQRTTSPPLLFLFGFSKLSGPASIHVLHQHYSEWNYLETILTVFISSRMVRRRQFAVFPTIGELRYTDTQFYALFISYRRASGG